METEVKSAIAEIIKHGISWKELRKFYLLALGEKHSGNRTKIAAESAYTIRSIQRFFNTPVKIINNE
jgi:hypothetical protein